MNRKRKGEEVGEWGRKGMGDWVVEEEWGGGGGGELVGKRRVGRGVGINYSSLTS